MFLFYIKYGIINNDKDYKMEGLGMLKYRIKTLLKPKVIFWLTFTLLFFVSMVSIARFYAADFDAIGSGITSGRTTDTVIINDLEADWNYYESLNFTELTSRNLPTAYTNKYNKDTLVAVELVYDGRDINDPSLVGKVSARSGEGQYKFIYYKYYPIDSDGNIKIELIDNPYTARPKVGSTYKGFNGWVCDDEIASSVPCSEMEFSYDYDYYLRYLTVKAPEANESGEKKLSLNLRATWVNGFSATNFTYNTFKNTLKTVQMINIGTEDVTASEDIYDWYFVKWIFDENRTYYEKAEAKENDIYFGYEDDGVTSCGVNGCTCEREVTEDGTAGTESSGSNYVPITCNYYKATTDEDILENKSYWFLNDSNVLEEISTDNGNGLVEFKEWKDTGRDDVTITGKTLKGYKAGDSLAGLYYRVDNWQDTANKHLYYKSNGHSCALESCTAGSTVYRLIQTDDDYLGTGGKTISKLHRDDEYIFQEYIYEVQGEKKGTKITNDVSNKYYYLVTRDINFLIPVTYTSGTNATIDDHLHSNSTIPLTVTSDPAGSYSTMRTFVLDGDIALVFKIDTVIENVVMRFAIPSAYSSNPANVYSESAYYDRGGVAYSNYHNVKYGRYITRDSNCTQMEGGYRYNLVNVIGGAQFTSSSETYGKSKTIIESGFMNMAAALGNTTGYSSGNSHNTNGKNINVIMQYGSDYDRAIGDNSKLGIRISAAAYRNSHFVSDSLIPIAQAIVKSGTFGIMGRVNDTSSTLSSEGMTGPSFYYTNGIYAGPVACTGNVSKALTELKVEGGDVLNINGGPYIANGAKVSTVTRITGGTAYSAVGGAGSFFSYGDRILSVSGGTIYFSVAGGSASYRGGTGGNNGQLKGNTLMYVGGTAVIGADGNQYNTLSPYLHGVTKGNVFGAGYGNTSNNVLGSVYDSHVIINGGTISGNVYGGGNYGVSGNSTDSTSTIRKTVVDVYDGNIKGSVYGGSNISGTSYTDATINLYGGTVNGSVYGGGKGVSTTVRGNTIINTNPDNDRDLIVKGSIYGGSEFGKVNNAGYTEINVTGGTLKNVYGGGKGNSTNKPISYGNITVNIKDGQINNVFGGSQTSGSVPYSGKTLKVNVSGGTTNKVFGGSDGANTAAVTTNVNVTGGNVSTVYGGSNAATTKTTTSNVTIDGGDIDSVYGGGYSSATITTNLTITSGNIKSAYAGGEGSSAVVTTSNGTISGGEILEGLYGGGKKAVTTTSKLTVTGGKFYDILDNSYANIYGGGEEAAVTTTTVNINSGANVYNVYGGSNISGKVTTANVKVTGGMIACNLYGGGYQAPIGSSNVSLTGSSTFSYTLPSNENVYNASCGMAFGGGASADVTGTANLTFDTTGKVVALYGGSNKAGNVAKTNVIVKRGVVSAVFGGNNYDGATGEASVTINQEAGKLTLDNVYGGSNGQNAIIGYEDGNGVYELGSTNVLFTAGTIKENIFGGGNEAPVFGNTNVTMTAGTVNRVYGGGNKAFIGDFDTTNTKFEVDKDAEAGIVESFVNISGGRVKNNVYGSGNASFVDGNTRVNLASSSTTAATTKTLRIDGSVFGGSETNADEDKTYQYKAIGVSGDATITVDGTGYFDEDGLSTVKINGSIYGGGNNSNTRGNAKLYVDKVGVKSTPMSMASIQRFSNVYIKDSVLELNGARDRSLQTRYTYGFVRIDNLYLLGTTTNASTLNGSTLYMARGNILVKKYFSGAMSDDYKSFVAQTTTENADGSLSNGYSDNKLYMYENIVFAVSTKEDVLYDATAGTVRGMTFLGMYNHGVDGDGLVTGVYDTAFKEGEKVGNLAYSQITSDAYTYAYGFHEFDPDYQIVTHGFYTNKVGTDQIVDVDYVGVTPLNLYYYKWVIGKERQQILVDLEASKNSTRESQNVKITLDQLKEQIGEHTFEWRDASMLINSVDTSTFKAAKDDVTIEFDTVLVDKTDIDAVNVNDDNGDGVVDANNYFALSMGTTSEGWLDNFKTNFYENGYSTEGDFCTDGSIGDCVGSAKYVYDSTTLQRGLTFWLDHSKNLDFSISTANDRENSIISLGTVTIKTVFTNPHADPGSANQQVEVDIIITITMTDSTRDVYGAAIAPGFKTKVFSSANTSIPTNGIFSIYQSLSLDLNQPMMKDETKMWEVDELYGQERTDEAGDHYSESYRYLASNYLFPKGTKITLLDLVRDEQYYYEVTKDNRNEVNNDANGSSEYRYMLENFIRMGSTSGDNKYDDDMNGANSTKYYTYADDGKIKFAVEEFVFNVDFSAVDAADMITEVKQFYLFMQLSYDKNGAETVLLSPDGDPTEGMAYILNPDITSKINSSGGFVEEGNDETVPTTEIYMGEDTDLKLYTTFVNQRADGTTATGVTNTTYENYKLGAKITIMKPSKDEFGNVIVDSSGNVVYEQVTGDMFGTVFTINGQKYYPQIDGTTRLQLAGRISDVISDINIDFENSSLVHDDYKIVVETFASYDGLYYGDADVVKIELPFKLLNNQYGLNVTIPPVQITHDVNTGKDKNGSNIINYIVDTKNGVADPYLRISLQRRNYNSYFDTSYTDIDLKNIVETINVGSDATNILDICYPDNSDICLIYTLTKMDTSKGTEQFEVNMTLKDGPTSDDLLDLSKSGWKSGTYRVVFTLYDGDVPVGSVYEYLIIRSLDIDEIIGRS